MTSRIPAARAALALAKSLGAKSLGTKSLGAKSLGTKSLGVASLGVACLGALGLGIAGLGASMASAHHSFAVYFDPAAEITLTGTVTAYRFTNPHGSISFDVTGADGTVEHWRAETNAPVVLQRRGWTRTSLRPGQTITITGWRARDGRPYMRLSQARDAQGNMVGTSAFGQEG